MDFKDRIRTLRVSLELTQTDLASKFGKTESATRAWELGRTKPDADTLIALSKYFDCSVDYLLGLSDIRNESERNQQIEIASDLHRKLLLIDTNAKRIMTMLADIFSDIASKNEIPQEHKESFFISVDSVVNNLAEIIKAYAYSLNLAPPDRIEYKTLFDMDNSDIEEIRIDQYQVNTAKVLMKMIKYNQCSEHAINDYTNKMIEAFKKSLKMNPNSIQDMLALGQFMIDDFDEHTDNI